VVATKLVLWKPLYKTTIVLYLLVLLLAFPAPIAATVLLFAIIAIWSRVPCFISEFTKDLEIVDFTTVVVTIYVGPVVGALFGSGIILGTRLFGPTEMLSYTIRDSICFFFGAFAASFMFAVTGGNVLVTMFSLTFVRYTLYPVLGLLFSPGLFVLDAIILSVSAPVAIMSNLFLVKVFGNSFDTMFEAGATLNWWLFLFVTVIIAVFFIVGRFMEKEEQKRMSHEEEPKEEYLDLGMVGSLAHAPEPHEAFFYFFDVGEVPTFLRTTKKLFIGFLTAALFVFIVVPKYQAGLVTSIWHYLLLAIGMYLGLSIMYDVLDKYLVKHPCR
jgi:hypothetical protein